MYRMTKKQGSVLIAALIATTFILPARSEDDAMARFENSLRPGFQIVGENIPTWALEERMAYYKVPGVSIAIIRGGHIAFAEAYGVKDSKSGQPVDTQTVFSVGSVSKVGAASLSLKLVSQGKLNLDSDINTYLQSWKVQTDRFTTARKITLRQLLSHTSGLSVHGFPDFLPGEELPTVFQTLDGIPPAKTEPVRPLFVPGTSAKYSGGGITVEQLLIENISGKSFEKAAREILFRPLGMDRSTYENPLPKEYGNIAHAHDENGAPVALPRGWHTFPEKAASGLWTTPTDVAKLIVALMESYHGEQNAFLPQELAVDMMTEIGPSYFGLGPQLTGSGVTRRFFHSGSNESYKAWIEGHLESGDGLVVFTNGANGKALYYEIRRAVADTLGWDFYKPVVLPRNIPNLSIPDNLTGDYKVNSPLSTASHRLRVMQRIEHVQIIQQTSGMYSMVFPDISPRAITLRRLGPLMFLAEDTYLGTPSQVRVEFVRDVGNRISELLLYRDRYLLSVVKASADALPVARH